LLVPDFIAQIDNEGFGLHVYTFMNEFAGYSCEIASNTLGIIMYAISMEIAKQKNWYVGSHILPPTIISYLYESN